MQYSKQMKRIITFAMVSILMTSMAIAKSDHDLTLLLIGDTNIQDREKPEEMIKHVADYMEDADVRFCNLEGPFAADPKNKDVHPIPHKGLWYHSTPDQVKGLLAAKIDGVGVANNVTYPWQALMKSLEVLDEAGIAHTGGGSNLEEAHKPVIVEKKGMRFGFIQYTATFWPYNHAATEEQPGVATVKIHTYYQPPKQVLDKPGQPPIIITIPDAEQLQWMKDDIKALKEKVDYVTVSYHWGVSNDLNLCDYQKTLARTAIESGADIVMGHGPHVIQPIELHQGKPIFYSLGNFVFDWFHMVGRNVGILVKVRFKDKELQNISLVPTTHDEENELIILSPEKGKGKDMIEQLQKLNADGGAELGIKGKEVFIKGL